MRGAGGPIDVCCGPAPFQRHPRVMSARQSAEAAEPRAAPPSGPRRRPSARRHSRVTYILTRSLLGRGPRPTGRQSDGRDLDQPSRSPGAPARVPRPSVSLQTAQSAVRGRASGPQAARAAAGPSLCPRARAVLAGFHLSTLLFTCPRGHPPVLFSTLPQTGQGASACEDVSSAGTPVTEPRGSRAGDTGVPPGRHRPILHPPHTPPRRAWETAGAKPHRAGPPGVQAAQSA